MSEEGQGIPEETPEAAVALEVLPDVTAVLTFTKEDVTKIKYAEEEKRLLARRKELEDEIRSLKGLRTSAEKKLTAILKSNADNIPDRLERLAEDLKVLGAIKVAYGVSRHLHDTDKDGEVETGKDLKMVTGVAVGEHEELSYTMAEGERSYQVGLPARYRAPNEAERALITNLEENSELTEAREEELFKTKEAIGGLPAFMRQLEAAMAQYVLASTSEGRTLMQAVADVETMLPRALEAPKADTCP